MSSVFSVLCAMLEGRAVDILAGNEEGCIRICYGGKGCSRCRKRREGWIQVGIYSLHGGSDILT